jgi:hypothetical protein
MGARRHHGPVRNRARAAGGGIFLLLLCLFRALPGQAADARPAGRIVELRLFRSGGSLCALVRARDLLDERTRSTVESGLPGTCIYHILLQEQNGRKTAERVVERTLRFDLWNNRYLLEEEADVRTYAMQAEADSALERLSRCDLCPLSRLRGEVEYRVVVRVAVRPLAPEDRERLSRYVSRTSGGGEEVAFDVGAVFDHLLGGSARALPVIEQIGPPFRLDDLPEAP